MYNLYTNKILNKQKQEEKIYSIDFDILDVDECMIYYKVIDGYIIVIYYGTGTVGMTPFSAILSLLVLGVGDAGVLSSRNSGFFTSISPA